MKILFLSFYFEPDLCAGSFRNTSLFNEIVPKLGPNDTIEVITTHPNRYSSYKVKAKDHERRGENVSIHRIHTPSHKNGLLSQINSFKVFYSKVLKITKKHKYDVVYASSSRLFTAFLGAKLAKKNKAKLYLDIRDIFRESIVDIFTNPIIKLGLDIILRPIEHYTFKKASHINLISKGFQSYFKQYNQCRYSYFTNGIDSVFLEERKEKQKVGNTEKTLVYAGNLGEGQGLHIIIPKVAKALEGKYKFIIFGDGGAKNKLLKVLKDEKVENVVLNSPINRTLLIEEYQKADFLFLHLNKHKAFERVLPSKLFEYGAFDKPIIAGVSGYAADFIKENISNAIVFNPGDVYTLVSELNTFIYKTEKRENFRNSFSRKLINIEMADSILAL